MKDFIISKIDEAAKELFGEAPEFSVEYPDAEIHGDYSVNIAFALSKKLKKSPKEIAETIVSFLGKKKHKEFHKIEVAGAGFINFFLSSEIVTDRIGTIAGQGIKKGTLLSGKKLLFEYTDPNPFKPFHIGHLMANAIGETLSRVASFEGAHVTRICYQGDVGLHVAKTIWGMVKNRPAFPEDGDSLEDKVKFLGNAYVYGNNQYEESVEAKEEIKAINKKVYDKSDQEILIYYEKGRKWSLEYFEVIYKKLGTKFDDYIFESEMATSAVSIVKDSIPSVFEESDGAVVFKGERVGLHTRVFLTSEGLPTYEAKEIALFFEKKKKFSYDGSFITSANEITEYFKVLKAVMLMLDRENGEKTHFVGHGILRFAEGKMSSRKGNVITGESLLQEIEEAVLEKMTARDLEAEEKQKIAERIAIAAVKYAILKQSPGKDIIFDREKSLSLEGDSGPYLLYAGVRASSVLEKAKENNISSGSAEAGWQATSLEKVLVRFEEVVLTSWQELAPQKLAQYLLLLAGEFNGFYAANQIVGTDDPNSSYKVSITEAFLKVLKEGLLLLGIETVEKM